MNTTHTNQPEYAATPSPRLEHPTEDAELATLHTAIQFCGLLTKFTALTSHR